MLIRLIKITKVSPKCLDFSNPESDRKVKIILPSPGGQEGSTKKEYLKSKGTSLQGLKKPMLTFKQLTC